MANFDFEANPWRPWPANENDRCALDQMPNKPSPPQNNAGPMGMQPAEHGPSAPTQMQPAMPAAKRGIKKEAAEESKSPAPEKRARTRTEAVRAARARITRRKSLRKQRDAQKT